MVWRFAATAYMQTFETGLSRLSKLTIAQIVGKANAASIGSYSFTASQVFREIASRVVGFSCFAVFATFSFSFVFASFVGVRDVSAA